ncbi:hypothetical protein [Pseudomonas aeruginosa]|uniref:hypothetical protein n=1 Tax=Pseudomonas aeruginosa TaxID=287 RepID=UPI000A93BCAB|nr:hypothetical protein [Pseudomonas aeruginosa]
MSSTQHQLIEQCATRLRGIVEALDNIHDNTPHRWSTDLDDVHSSAESLLSLIKDQAPPSEDQLIAAGLSYPLAKEDAVQLWYAGFRSEVVTVLEAWEAIGHDIGMNPSKGELLDSLRNMAAICNAHGNDMPAQSAIDQRQVIADAITGALAFGAQASQPPAEDHWLRPFYDIGRAEGQRTQELAMLVRMLASSLKRHAPESNLVARATNYLAAKGLAGTPFRDAPASVEQAGGDERAEFRPAQVISYRPGMGEVTIYVAGRVPGYMNIGDTVYVSDRAPVEQPSAALAQPSPTLPPFAEKVLAKLRRFYDCAEDFESGGVDIGRHWLDLLTQLGLLNRVQRSPALWEISQQGEDLLGTPHPSPAQAEQAEAERPEVVGQLVTWPTGQRYVGRVRERKGCKTEDVMTVAQHERIVGELRADRDSWAEQAEQRLADWDEMRKERDAALANVDALAVQVLKLGGTISLAHHRSDQAGQVPQAWLDVQAERRRQITAEGWTPEHDDEHSHGQMARAAACYALAGSSAPNDGTAALLVSLAWPWDEQWWKPSTARRDMVKACALGLAEIERLDRAAATQGGPRDA